MIETRRTAETIIQQLNAAGLTLTTDGVSVDVAPKSRLTDELRTLIRQHRDELLIALAERRLTSGADWLWQREPCRLEVPGYQGALFGFELLLLRYERQDRALMGRVA